eukprot:6485537-Amphidinium_carterae.5
MAYHDEQYVIDARRERKALHWRASTPTMQRLRLGGVVRRAMLTAWMEGYVPLTRMPNTRLCYVGIKASICDDDGEERSLEIILQELEQELDQTSIH